MKLTPVALVIAIAVVLTHPSPVSVHAQPEVTETSPQDRAILAEPPKAISLCFSEPVLVDDPKDFSFNVTSPDGLGLGLRIVFQPDGFGVDVHPGPPHGGTEGRWTFTWMVTAAADGEVASGTLRFTVREGGNPEPPEAANPCGGRPLPRGSPIPGATPDAIEIGEDDGPNILNVALITVGSIAGAALLAILLYRIRRGIR